MSKKQFALASLAVAFDGMIASQLRDNPFHCSVAFDFETESSQHVLNVLIEKANGHFSTLTIAFLSQDLEYIASKCGQFFGDELNSLTIVALHSSESLESVVVRI